MISSESTPFLVFPKLNGAIAYGGDYNPEQWPESVWKDDIQLMKQAGVNLVTIGVFSWSKLQQNELNYHFEWLDRIFDLLGNHGIFVDMATATATPPPWLSNHYSDVLAVDASGVPMSPGSRQHCSPFSPSYQKFAQELVHRIAERYCNHPALTAWHINNEYACHTKECHSAAAVKAFQEWLERKYGTLDALNDAWSTAFWSQYYYQWDEILTPRKAPYFGNPAQSLDYQRFMSNSLLELFRVEHEILRTYSTDIPITTNFMGFHKPVDCHKFAPEMDFASWDSYPDPTPGLKGEIEGASGHDLTRSLKKDRPFVLMEQATSSSNWREVNQPKRPSQMRIGSYQAIARGSDAVLFFQWRASRGGGEKFHSAMVPHVDPQQSRIFNEVCELGQEMKKLSPIVGSVVEADVAIVFDWENWWAVEIDGKQAKIDYAVYVKELYEYFYQLNLTVDFVHPSEDLSAYKLVVAPCLYMLTAESAANLTEFVHRGGNLVTTYFSGIVDENEQIVLGGYGGYLREVMGLWVEEWLPLQPEDSVEVQFNDGTHGQCYKFCESVHTTGAEVIATFGEEFLKGRAACTKHNYGKGQSFYIAGHLDRSLRDRILDEAVIRAGIEWKINVTKHVEMVTRVKGAKRFVFLINHSYEPVCLHSEVLVGTELLRNTKVEGEIEIEAKDVAVIECA